MSVNSDATTSTGEKYDSINVELQKQFLQIKRQEEEGLRKVIDFRVKDINCRGILILFSDDEVDSDDGDSPMTERRRRQVRRCRNRSRSVSSRSRSPSPSILEARTRNADSEDNTDVRSDINELERESSPASDRSGSVALSDATTVELNVESPKKRRDEESRSKSRDENTRGGEGSSSDSKPAETGKSLIVHMTCNVLGLRVELNETGMKGSSDVQVDESSANVEQPSTNVKQSSTNMEQSSTEVSKPGEASEGMPKEVLSTCNEDDKPCCKPAPRSKKICCKANRVVNMRQNVSSIEIGHASEGILEVLTISDDDDELCCKQSGPQSEKISCEAGEVMDLRQNMSSSIQIGQLFCSSSTYQRQETVSQNQLQQSAARKRRIFVPDQLFEPKIPRENE